jgi:GT2 family glycosyltransferase
MDLSIIIVNYNTKDLLKQTIQSVIDTINGIDYQIIIIDNASKDGSCDMVKKAFDDKTILIESMDNEGYAKANNKGIKLAKGRYILLLNSDTVVIEDCIQKCIDYMDKATDIGVLGCKIVLPDGKLDRACKRGFPTPEASLYYMLKLDKLFPSQKKYGKYNLTYLDENETNQVDSVVGAFMMIRREVIGQVGMLDEDFFMYGEDLDWCYRIKESGWNIVYYPEAQIIHYKGASSKKKRWKTIYEFHRAMYLFYNKHYFKKYNFFVTSIVYTGIGLKLLLSLLINIFRGKNKDD